jgi:16S rRNA (guanine966-N2)-methyltransferase
VTRIIGGSAKGRRLQTPPGDATRPTSDRVREALFSAWESQLGSLHGLRVLDLYAGSGAVGLEAASRGAAAVTAVESDRRTAALITANARTLGYEVEVLVALELLVRNDWLKPGASVVLERSARSVEPGWPTGLGPIRQKKYGETLLWYLRRADEDDLGAPGDRS